MGLGTTTIIIVTLLSPWLVELLTTNEYYSSWPIVGILAWQSLFYGFFLIASAGIWKVEKTSLNLYLMLASTAFGLVLNWLLVPKYAEIGAAIASSITYLFWVVISMVVSEFYWKTGFSWMVFAIQVSCGVVFVVWYIVEGFICNLYITLTVSFFVTGILLLTSIEKPKLMSLIRPFKTE
jgi:O-antigen/teichoic acid export membrane protein